MAEEKETSVAPKGVPPAQMASAGADKVGEEKKVEVKKLDDIKETPENKAALAERFRKSFRFIMSWL